MIEVDGAAGNARELVGAPTDYAPPEGSLRSPDGKLDLLTRDGNLFIAPAGGDDVRALTTDGYPDHGYGIEPGSSLVAVTNRVTETAVPPIARWSPDSRRILTHRLDQRHVPELEPIETSS